MIYFDNAASTPVYDIVTDYMNKLQKNVFGNPSASHSFGRKARIEVERTRKKIAEKLNVKTSEIYFTSGGTEGNNAILWGCARDLERKVFITSPTEHPCVLNTLESISKELPVQVKFVDVNSEGYVDLKHLDFLLSESPRSVVSLMHANNETGVILPVMDIAFLCKNHRALFHSDIVQSAGKLDLDLEKSGFDFAVGSAHKFHGPKGIGFMYVKSPNFFKSYTSGGRQERKMRAGTENVVGICGMGVALEWALYNLDATINNVRNLKNELIRLLEEEIPEVKFNGDPKNENSLHTIVNISLPETYDKELLLAKLDIEGIAVSAGSACNSGVEKGSHVLTALGADPARPALRVSFSTYNSIDEVRKFVDVLKKIKKEK